MTPPPTLSPTEVRKTAIAALEGLQWLLERVAAYPPGHPVVGKARDRTWGVLDQALGSLNTLRVDVGRNVLRLAFRPVDSHRCRLLGSALAELDIVSLTLTKGIAPDELLTLVRRLAALRASGGAQAAREELADRAPSPHVEIDLLDYAALPVGEGAQQVETPAEVSGGDHSARIWNVLSHNILGGKEVNALAPERLADMLGDEIVFEGIAPEILAGQLTRLLIDVESLDPEERREGLTRIGRFLAALPRTLREELLRVDPTLARTRSLPPDRVVTALLLGVIRGGERPPEDAVALLNQLLRSSSADDHTQEHLARVAEGRVDPEELERLGTSVGEIFRKRASVRANPEVYQAVIDGLAKYGASAVADARAWIDRFEDPGDLEGSRAHTVEIAAELLRDPGTTGSAERIFAFLGSSIDRLIDGGRVVVLEDAVCATESMSSAESREDDRPDAANGWIHDVYERSRLSRVLGIAIRDAGSVEAALALIRRAGPSATDVILSTISGNIPQPLSGGLGDILAGLPPDVVLSEVRRRAGGGWGELRPLFPVLKRLQGEAAPMVQDLLVSFLNHPDAEVRRHALSALSGCSLQDARAGEALASLLQDPNPAIVRQAIRKLEGRGGRSVLPPLEMLVLGRAAHGRERARSDLRLLAIRALAERGPAGRESLEGCLKRMAWRLRRDDVTISFAIAAAIERCDHGPDTARMLRRWRRSPVRYLLGLSLRSRKTP